MKINIFDAPPTLWFGDEGDPDRFGLAIKRYSGSDRMGVFDAVASGSFEAIEQSAARLVTGWDNVRDERGNAIPFETEDKGRTIRNLDIFLGAMPLLLQMDVMLGVIAFIGVPNPDLRATRERLVEVIANDPGLKAIDLDPTSTQAEPTEATASNGCSTSAGSGEPVTPTP